MLAGVRRRAERAELLPRIRLVQADAASLQISGAFDFALAFWMLHEVPESKGLLQLVAGTLRPGGHFLLVEPKGHVRRTAFDESVRTAEAVGLIPAREPKVPFSHAVLMTHRSGSAA